MTEWILIFVMSTGNALGAAGPFTEDKCVWWRSRMKPEQHAACIRIDTVFVDGEPYSRIERSWKP